MCNINLMFILSHLLCVINIIFRVKCGFNCNAVKKPTTRLLCTGFKRFPFYSTGKFQSCHPLLKKRLLKLSSRSIYHVLRLVFRRRKCHRSSSVLGPPRDPPRPGYSSWANLSRQKSEKEHENKTTPHFLSNQVYLKGTRQK